MLPGMRAEDRRMAPPARVGLAPQASVTQPL